MPGDVSVDDLKVVEICAGAGGQSLGLHRAGFVHELALELDANAAATLRANLSRLNRPGPGPDVRVGDVADPELWTPEKYQGIDLLAGGVPCPPFSIAGRQLGSQDERDLFAWAVELAGRMKPRALLLENVRGLAAPRFAGYRQAVADRLEELGYWSEWRLLQASDFGVAQLRPRFILVALRAEDAAFFHWPTPKPTKKTVGSVLKPLMAENGWIHVDEWASIANRIAPTVVGGSKKHGGADLGPTRAKQAWAALGVDGKGVADAAPNMTAPPASLVKPRLTNEMVARIQGWGGHGYRWDFVGRKTSVYRQIGNAFPPPVARAIGTSIAEALGRAQPNGLGLVEQSHELVYRLLRSATVPLTSDRILQELSGVIDSVELGHRLRLLGNDFELDILETREGPAWKLGEFRAFRGQADHQRTEAFASRSIRSRVS
jgi:DNA (cytosine-5)-methyltransferase 1